MSKSVENPSKWMDLERRIEELEANMKVMILRTSKSYNKEWPVKESNVKTVTYSDGGSTKVG